MNTTDTQTFNQAVSFANQGQKAEANRQLKGLLAANPTDTNLLLWAAFTSSDLAEAGDLIDRASGTGLNNPALEQARQWLISEQVKQTPKLVPILPVASPPPFSDVIRENQNQQEMRSNRVVSSSGTASSPRVQVWKTLDDNEENSVSPNVRRYGSIDPNMESAWRPPPTNNPAVILTTRIVYGVLMLLAVGLALSSILPWESVLSAFGQVSVNGFDKSNTTAGASLAGLGAVCFISALSGLTSHTAAKAWWLLVLSISQIGLVLFVLLNISKEVTRYNDEGSRYVGYTVGIGVYLAMVLAGLIFFLAVFLLGRSEYKLGE